MPPTADQQRTAPELRIAVMRLARRLRNERLDDQLTPSQMAVLGTLSRQGPQTSAALAAIEHVQPPSMTRIVSALESLGLVIREDHPDDRRQILVRMTDRGRTRVRDDRERRDLWLSRRLAELTPTELVTLQASLPILDRLATTP